MSDAGSHGEHEAFGNALVEDTVEAATPGRGGLLGGLFNRTDSQNARKTVTFGDASAVRSLPMYSLLALLLMLFFWFVATVPWGFPDDFRSVVDQEFAVAADDATLFIALVRDPRRYPVRRHRTREGIIVKGTTGR